LYLKGIGAFRNADFKGSRQRFKESQGVATNDKARDLTSLMLARTEFFAALAIMKKRGELLTPQGEQIEEKASSSNVDRGTLKLIDAFAKAFVRTMIEEGVLKQAKSGKPSDAVTAEATKSPRRIISPQTLALVSEAKLNMAGLKVSAPDRRQQIEVYARALNELVENTGK
jgi:hypothetical protein